MVHVPNMWARGALLKPKFHCFVHVYWEIEKINSYAINCQAGDASLDSEATLALPRNVRLKNTPRTQLYNLSMHEYPTKDTICNRARV